MDTYAGLVEGEQISKLFTINLLFIGLAEIIIGGFANSIGLTADGIDSLADATISLIVWQGLRLSRKAPDERFHFGYLKVDSLAGLISSIGMIVIASSLLYLSYLRFLDPAEISFPIVALATLAVAGCISTYRAIQMWRVSKKYTLLSLKAGSYNAIKDGSASFVILGTVFASVLGYQQMDAVGGMIIAGYIYSVAYVSIKESSLVLIDACQCPGVTTAVKKIIESTCPVKVEEVRLRKTGPYIAGIISIAADGTLTLNEVDEFKQEIKNALNEQIKGLGTIDVVFHPKKSSPKIEGQA